MSVPGGSPFHGNCSKPAKIVLWVQKCAKSLSFVTDTRLLSMVIVSTFWESFDCRMIKRT